MTTLEQRLSQMPPNTDIKVLVGNQWMEGTILSSTHLILSLAGPGAHVTEIKMSDISAYRVSGPEA